MSTSVVGSPRAPQSIGRSRAVGAGLAALVLALGIGLGLSADRSDPTRVVDANVTRLEPSIQARRLQMTAEQRALRLQAIIEHRTELALRHTPFDGSIGRS
ncbi:MAG TPA: hypothetical protein VI193_07435 [Acidimicrobiia bacterium]